MPRGGLKLSTDSAMSTSSKEDGIATTFRENSVGAEVSSPYDDNRGGSMELDATSPGPRVGPGRRSRYSMNYQSYEATRIQPAEQTRRMLDYMFPGYQKRDPRNWYEKATQTHLNADEVKNLIGIELMEVEPIEEDDDYSRFEDKDSKHVIDDDEDADRFVRAEKFKAKPRRSSVVSKGWDGPPITVTGKASEEGFFIQIQDANHEPQTIIVPKDVFDHKTVKLDVVPDDRGIPKVIVYVGDSNGSNTMIDSDVEKPTETMVLYDNKDEFASPSISTTSEASPDLTEDQGEESPPPIAVPIVPPKETSSDDILEDFHPIARDSVGEISRPDHIEIEYDLDEPEQKLDGSIDKIEPIAEMDNRPMEPVQPEGDEEEIVDNAPMTEESDSKLSREVTNWLSNEIFAVPVKPKSLRKLSVTPEPLQAPEPLQVPEPLQEPEFQKAPEPKEATPEPPTPDPRNLSKDVSIWLDDNILDNAKQEASARKLSRDVSNWLGKNLFPIAKLAADESKKLEEAPPEPERVPEYPPKVGSHAGSPADSLFDPLENCPNNMDEEVTQPTPLEPLSTQRAVAEDKPLSPLDDYPPQFGTNSSSRKASDPKPPSKTLEKFEKSPSIVTSHASSPGDRLFGQLEDLPIDLPEERSSYSQAKPQFLPATPLKPTKHEPSPLEIKSSDNCIQPPSILKLPPDAAISQENQPRNRVRLDPVSPDKEPTPTESDVGGWVNNEILVPAAAENWVDKKIVSEAQARVYDDKKKLPRLAEALEEPEPRSWSAEPKVESVKPPSPDEGQAPPKGLEKQVDDWMDTEVLMPAQVDEWVDRNILKPVEKLKPPKLQPPPLQKSLTSLEMENWISGEVLQPAKTSLGPTRLNTRPNGSSPDGNDNRRRQPLAKSTFDESRHKTPDSSLLTEPSTQARPGLEPSIKISPNFGAPLNPVEEEDDVDKGESPVEKKIDDDSLSWVDSSQNMSPFQPHPDHPGENCLPLADTPQYSESVDSKTMPSQPSQGLLNTYYRNAAQAVRESLPQVSYSNARLPGQSLGESIPVQDQVPNTSSSTAQKATDGTNNHQTLPEQTSPPDKTVSKITISSKETITLLPSILPEEPPQVSENRKPRGPDIPNKPEERRLSVPQHDVEPSGQSIMRNSSQSKPSKSRTRTSLREQQAIDKDNYLTRDDDMDYELPAKHSRASITTPVKRRRSDSFLSQGSSSKRLPSSFFSRLCSPLSKIANKRKRSSDSLSKSNDLRMSQSPAKNRLKTASKDGEKVLDAKAVGKIKSASDSDLNEVRHSESPQITKESAKKSLDTDIATLSIPFSTPQARHSESPQTMKESVKQSLDTNNATQPIPFPTPQASSEPQDGAYRVPVDRGQPPAPFQAKKNMEEPTFIDPYPEDIQTAALPKFRDYEEAAKRAYQPNKCQGTPKIPQPPKRGFPTFPDYKDLTKEKNSDDEDPNQGHSWYDSNEHPTPSPTESGNDIVIGEKQNSADRISVDRLQEPGDGNGNIEPQTSFSQAHETIDKIGGYDSGETVAEEANPTPPGNGIPMFADYNNLPTGKFPTFQDKPKFGISKTIYGTVRQPETSLPAATERYIQESPMYNLNPEDQRYGKVRPKKPVTPAIHKTDKPQPRSAQGTGLPNSHGLQGVPIQPTITRFSYSNPEKPLTELMRPTYPGPLQDSPQGQGSRSFSEGQEEKNSKDQQQLSVPDNIELPLTPEANLQFSQKVDPPGQPQTSNSVHDQELAPLPKFRSPSPTFKTSPPRNPWEVPSSIPYDTSHQLPSMRKPGDYDQRQMFDPQGFKRQPTGSPPQQPTPGWDGGYSKAGENHLGSLGSGKSANKSLSAPSLQPSSNPTLTRFDYSQPDRQLSDLMQQHRNREGIQNPQVSAGQAMSEPSANRIPDSKNQPKLATQIQQQKGLPIDGHPPGMGTSADLDQQQKIDNPPLHGQFPGFSPQKKTHEPMVSAPNEQKHSSPQTQVSPYPTLTKRYYTEADRPIEDLLQHNPQNVQEGSLKPNLNNVNHKKSPVPPGHGVPKFGDYEQQPIQPHISPQISGDHEPSQGKPHIVTAAEKKAQIEKEMKPITEQIEDLKKQMYRLTSQKGPPIHTSPHSAISRPPTSLELYKELERRTLDATRKEREAYYAERRKKVYEENARRKIKQAIERSKTTK